GVFGLLSPWLALPLLASGVAFFAAAKSFQEGDAVPVIAITSAAANISSIAGGILVFGDPTPAGPFGLVAQGLGLVAILVAAALMPSFSARHAVAAAPA